VLQFLKQDGLELAALVVLHALHLHEDLVVQLEAVLELEVLRNQVGLLELVVDSDVHHFGLVALGQNLVPDEVELSQVGVLLQKGFLDGVQHD